jgi:hypothetical protein
MGWQQSFGTRDVGLATVVKLTADGQQVGRTSKQPLLRPGRKRRERRVRSAGRAMAGEGRMEDNVDG